MKKKARMTIITTILVLDIHANVKKKEENKK